MDYNFTFTYLKCQSCTAKIHCEDCARELCQRLMGQGNVFSAEVDIQNKTLCVRADMDEMDLLDLLEDAGVFAD